jgi:hypothetical protein
MAGLFDNRRQIVYLAASFLAATIVLLIPLPATSRVMTELESSGHSILFGVLALIAFRFSRNRWEIRESNSLRPYFLAFVGTLCFGILTEIAQTVTGRDGDLYDVMMDGIGILSFLGFYWTLGPKHTQLWSGAAKWRKYIVRASSIVLLSTAFIRSAAWSLAFVERDRGFPTLCRFDSRWSTMFVTPQEADMESVAPPQGWNGVGTRVGKVSLSAGSFPGLRVDEPFPDWRGFKAFCFTIYSENLDTLKFGLRIDDAHHNYEMDDRFNVSFVIHQGVNEFEFSLADVKAGPVKRETDMAHIASFAIFSSHPQRPFTVYFGEIRLR